MGFQDGQTAVIVPVPAVEEATSPWRGRFDTSAPFGVPAHVTIVFPFVPLPQLSTRDIVDLASLFADEPACTVDFARLARFAGAGGAADVLYLEPTPDGAFRRLTAALVSRWPQAPPYAGQVADPTPHLTVTETAPADMVEAARVAVGAWLPITAHITVGCLLAFDGARWRVHTELPMGQASAPRAGRSSREGNSGET